MTIYAVNGKEPIAAWIPSLDSSGNGTTTLTDLTGNGRNGTLTNFALSGSTSNWVADTGAGGVRALAFDGVDDLVNHGTGVATAINGQTAMSLSCWLNMTNYGANGAGLGRIFEFGNTNFTSLCTGNQLIYWRATADSVAQVAIPPSLGSWCHVCAVQTLGTPPVWYLNGTARAWSGTPTGGAGTFVASGNFILGNRENQVRGFCGSMDDVRLFNVALTAFDVGLLYNSGTGRGITFGGGSGASFSNLGKGQLYGGFSRSFNGGFAD